MHNIFRYIVFIFLALFSQDLFGQCDTNEINKTNDAIFNLVYENPSKALKMATDNEKKAENCRHYIGQIRAIIRKGIAYDLLNENNKSILEYKKALTLSQRENYLKGIASCENNIGLIYWKIGNLNAALKYFIDAESSFKKQADYLNMASVYNNIGLIYNEKENYKKGIQMYRKSIRYSRLAKDETFILNVYSNLSNDFLTLKEYDSSLYYANLGIKGYQATHNKYGEAIILNNIGNIYFQTNLIDEALIAFEESRQIAKEIGNKIGFASATFNMSRCYDEKKNFQKSESLLTEAIPIATEIEAYELLYKMHSNLANISVKLGKSDQAIESIEKYKIFHKIYSDQILDENISKMEAQFEVKEEKERAKLIKQKANQRIREQTLARKYDNIKWITLVSLLFLIGIIIFILNKKANLKKELEKQKSIFNATIEERKRISYDLHDMLGSQLSYVVNNLEMMQLTSGKNERIDKTFEMSQDAMRSLRDTVWTLNTEEITLTVLKERMQNVCRKWLEESGIEVEFEYQFDKESMRLESNVILQFMQIFQEAVSNIRKHADTKKVKIIFVVINKVFDLVIMDYGKGMENTGEKPFHFGLKSMEERADKLHASLTFENNSEGGLSVHLHWENKSNA